MWKKGTGEVESVCGAPPGIVATTASTDHDGFMLWVARTPGTTLVSMKSSSEVFNIPVAASPFSFTSPFVVILPHVRNLDLLEI